MICLDSDLLIDFLKGKEYAVNAIGHRFNDIVTTEINVFETFVGIYNKKIVSTKEEVSASNFFNSIEVLSFQKGAGKLAARIFSGLRKEGKLIDQNDCLIAGIMLKNGCDTILTRNIKHFSRIKDIKVESY